MPTPMHGGITTFNRHTPTHLTSTVCLPGATLKTNLQNYKVIENTRFKEKRECEKFVSEINPIIGENDHCALENDDIVTIQMDWKRFKIKSSVRRKRDEWWVTSFKVRWKAGSRYNDTLKRKRANLIKTQQERNSVSTNRKWRCIVEHVH